MDVCWGREGGLDLFGTSALICPVGCKSSCLPAICSTDKEIFHAWAGNEVQEKQNPT